MYKRGFFMIKKVSAACIVTLIAFMITACYNPAENSEDSNLAMMRTTKPTPIILDDSPKDASINQVRDEVDKLPEIYDSIIIEKKDKMIVAYKVRHLYRFKMKKIEKKLRKKLESTFPDKKFTLSSDYKIFLEAVRIKEGIEEGRLSKKEASKRFKEIIKLNKERT